MDTAAVILASESKASTRTKAFWVLWALELWERFGYYGVQAILALYFVSHLGYTESESFYIFGSFSAFVYGFVWIGGWLGDNYLGAKRTLLLGAIILTSSYLALAVLGKGTIFYALAGIIVGNTLFKANPSSLISKLYHDHEQGLDGAMTLYYMAVNVGSMLSMTITPIIAAQGGWLYAFGLCALGLVIGLACFLMYREHLSGVSTPAGRQAMDWQRLAIVLFGSVLSIIVIAQFLMYTWLCTCIIYGFALLSFAYYFKLTAQAAPHERTRMLIAFILILQAVIFFVLYNQMPTSLTFFAVHNVNNHFMQLNIPAAEYQVLNAVVIVVMSPILAKCYTRWPATHITKFCIGMSLCAIAFLALAISKYFAHNGLVSPVWMLVTYFFQSTGELLISGLGLAMVAALCPRRMTGFVMGLWFLATMLAGPLGAWVGAMTTPHVSAGTIITAQQSLEIYSQVFAEIGLLTGAVALAMWLFRPALNRRLNDCLEGA